MEETSSDSAVAPGLELFGTETMAELCARQGRVAEAVAIYRRLVEASPGDSRCTRWTERLASLERARRHLPDQPRPAAPPRLAPAAARSFMPLVLREPVRSGQLVRAERSDVIVLAPVNPGGRIVADGNIHVYATLRGTAIAGAQGERDARIFCQKLDAELLAIDGVYLTADEIPAERRGKPAQVSLSSDGRCIVAPL